jgi:hypothetical protein
MEDNIKMNLRETGLEAWTGLNLPEIDGIYKDGT